MVELKFYTNDKNKITTVKILHSKMYVRLENKREIFVGRIDIDPDDENEIQHMIHDAKMEGTYFESRYFDIDFSHRKYIQLRFFDSKGYEYIKDYDILDILS